MEKIIDFPGETASIGNNQIRFHFETPQARQFFLGQFEERVQKTQEVREKKYTCGDCAAYLCFRNHGESSSAGLCFQIIRECRQECDYFIKDMDSGNAPEFQITGKCKKNGETVNYDSECKFANVDN